MPKKIVNILGSTGSIGQNAIKFLKDNPDFEVGSLVANNNVERLAEQINLLKPKFAAILNEDLYPKLKELVRTETQIAAGKEAVAHAASLKSDITLAAIVGIAGLEPTMKAIESGSDIALANKECLVCGGEIFLEIAKKHNVKIIPVDSEHNAIFQVMPEEKDRDTVAKIILTASGGPFLHRTNQELETVTIEQALAHPNWSMGSKITIDSATMVNKALEIIEAYYLFGFKKDKIEVVIHPQSIIHSMVEYIDGSILSMLSNPDMTIPIIYALTWPKRVPYQAKPLNYQAGINMQFLAPDYNRFPVLNLAKDLLEEDLSKKIIFNGANEIANQMFLNGEIKFKQIYKMIYHAIENLKFDSPKTIEDIISIDREVKAKTRELQLTN